MTEVKVTKYLGDCLAPSLEDSVHQTVLKRIGLANHSIYEIRTIIEDSRAGTIGGINIGYTIWEQAVIPSLLYNSESWLSISKKTIKLLNNLFNKFHQTIMRIGSGCPIVNYYWQTASMKVKYIILKKNYYSVSTLQTSPSARLVGKSMTSRSPTHLALWLSSRNT